MWDRQTDKGAWPQQTLTPTNKGGVALLQVGNQRPERAREAPKVAKPFRSTPGHYHVPREILSKTQRNLPTWISRLGHRGEAQGNVQGHRSRWLRDSVPPPSWKACYVIAGKSLILSSRFLCRKMRAGSPHRTPGNVAVKAKTMGQHPGTGAGTWGVGGTPELHLRPLHLYRNSTRSVSPLGPQAVEVFPSSQEL